jgi:putative FmdB family regulatory protein
MPTYEYVCTSCGLEFELVQKMSDPPRKRCPKCRHKVDRKPGAGAGILFKGSGFYATDYRSSEYRAKAKAEQTARGATKSSTAESSGSATTGKAGSSGGSKDGAPGGPKKAQ